MHVVTGAFGYSGRFIARRLLAAGMPVRTLTNSPQRENEFGGRIEVHPLAFDNPEQLTESLRGAAVLYNTYWVRFNHRDFKHATAVDNTLKLFDAAKRAGVGRIVHVSITNPSEDSPLEYFRGKARLERALRESGLSHSILRPAVLFGEGDILINNIAWMLRHMPFFGVFGDGQYRLQPIHVGDFAALATREANESGSRVIDAIGPETFTFRELVTNIAAAIGVHRRIVSVSPTFGYWIGRIAGAFLGDLMITREEIRGLMDNLLVTNSPPAGTTSLSEWVRKHNVSVGRRYASELGRRRNRTAAYNHIH